MFRQTDFSFLDYNQKSLTSMARAILCMQKFSGINM